ncbi:MAG: hypothetical protein QOH24_2174 [Verrucomicrobiota bacterium]|jgi:hypothetical protein
MPISELTKQADALKAPTKDFAIRIFRLVDALPKSLQGRAVANQIIRSGTLFERTTAQMIFDFRFAIGDSRQA